MNFLPYFLTVFVVFVTVFAVFVAVFAVFWVIAASAAFGVKFQYIHYSRELSARAAETSRLAARCRLS